MMISLMDREKPKTVLEIGCGTGKNAFMIAQKTAFNVVGVDICLPFIEEARKNYSLPNLSYELLDLNNLKDFEGKKFDYIVGNGILHHLYYSIDNTLITLKGLLAKDGKLIFIEPNIYNPYVYLIFSVPFLRKVAHLEPDEMAFSKNFILSKLKKSFFDSCEVKYKDFLLPGTPSFLVKPLIYFGSFAEKIPLIKMLSQSIFIVATD